MEHEQPHSTGPTGPTFDTLAASEALKDAGFSDRQAKAVTHTIVAAQDNLASKADLRALRADFKEFRAEIMAEFKAQRTQIQSLKDSVESLKSLVMYVVLPLAMGAILISLTVFGFVMTRIPPA